jgi:pyruvate/2-oxoglutarate dehydrogenase complex dihydrolipoamide dehydrogenase (E3) component
MGGDCLNHGCVPSKALIAAARRAQTMREAAPFGIVSSEPRIDFASVKAHIRDTITAIAPKDSEARFAGLGVRVIRSAARFIDRNRLAAGGETITARRFVIATGSSPSIPAIPGLGNVPYLTNETIFDVAELPRHLVIIGAGAVGLELAQAFRRLGSEVSIIETAEPLRDEDPELAAIALDAVRKEGVVLHARTEVTAVRIDGDGVAVEYAANGLRGGLNGSHLLVAAGRKPNIDGLGLDTAGIAHTVSGITIDSGLRTTNRRCYAIGDVAGGQFTHLAGDHAGLVIRNALFRLPVKTSPDRIPRVTFTDPELAQVGLTETAARERHGDSVTVIRSSFSDNDRAVIEQRTAGLIKLVIGRGGRILGAGIVGADSGELIQTFSLAIAQRLALKSLIGMIAPYPTLSEVSKQAALTHYAGLAANPWVRRAVGLLASFG